MATYDEMRVAAEAAWTRIERPERPLFAVSVNTSSIASGALETLAALREAGERDGFDVMQTGDTGFAWAEPVVQVTQPDGRSILYGHVAADSAAEFAAAATAGVAQGHALGVVAGGPVSGVEPLESTGWMRLQTRWLMRNCGVIDPDSIDHYIARGGYGAYMRARAMDGDELIKVITGSTLRGHSGSFFSTGTKWGFLRTATREPRYLVCNADEGDPGAWVNRVLMESDPHSIIEGMIVGAYATGATHGWIYIRDEYPLCVERVDRALQQARERGILGSDALGAGVAFDAEVVRGAGSYVCGDETGLMSSISDDRGMPRIKPPFPAERGVLGLPSNVNNVETYACVTALLRVGADTYSTVGTETNRGTKMLTVSGACAKSGCLEVPFGTTVRDVLAAAGGIAGGREFKALQVGGPLCGLLPGEIAAGLALEPEPFRPLGAGMGGGGLVFVDETACVVDLNVLFSWFLEDESCGRCTTCRGANQRAVEIFRRTASGEAQDGDVERLQSLGDSMQYANCFHGTLSPVIFRNTLKYFRDEYDAHALEHRCPAKVCAGLIRYRVVNQTPAVGDAAKICPTEAIAQADAAWTIDDARCIRCDACREIAPDDIATEDKYRDMIPLRTLAPADVARAG